MGDCRCGFVSLSQSGGSCTPGRAAFLPDRASQVCLLYPKWTCWVASASIYKMPIPAACVCQAHRISRSSGCPGICLLLSQIFDFWPPWDCQWEWQLRQQGLAMDTWVVFLGFSLLAARAMAFGATLTDRKSDLHPRLWSIVFSFLTHRLCRVTLLGPSDSVGHGGLSVCPRRLVPSPVSDCLRSGGHRLQCPLCPS